MLKESYLLGLALLLAALLYWGSSSIGAYFYPSMPYYSPPLLEETNRKSNEAQLLREFAQFLENERVAPTFRIEGSWIERLDTLDLEALRGQEPDSLISRSQKKACNKQNAS
ncbi:MAG: hypothetical protein HC913_18825 [Microscillaceae bacterium]|nr:hypothetical protein [Microscillaceae bacterium]